MKDFFAPWKDFFPIEDLLKAFHSIEVCMKAISFSVFLYEVVLSKEPLIKAFCFIEHFIEDIKRI